MNFMDRISSPDYSGLTIEQRHDLMLRNTVYWALQAAQSTPAAAVAQEAPQVQREYTLEKHPSAPQVRRFPIPATMEV